jgi:hypothetical protein
LPRICDARRPGSTSSASSLRRTSADKRHAPRCGERIGGAHVGDDLHALGGAERQHRAKTALQQRIETCVRVFQFRQLRDGDGAFGEALEHEIVQRPVAREFDGRLYPVALKARARAQSDCFRHALFPRRTG